MLVLFQINFCENISGDISIIITKVQKETSEEDELEFLISKLSTLNRGTIKKVLSE